MSLSKVSLIPDGCLRYDLLYLIWIVSFKEILNKSNKNDFVFLIISLFVSFSKYGSFVLTLNPLDPFLILNSHTLVFKSKLYHLILGLIL